MTYNILFSDITFILMLLSFAGIIPWFRNKHKSRFTDWAAHSALLLAVLTSAGMLVEKIL